MASVSGSLGDAMPFAVGAANEYARAGRPAGAGVSFNSSVTRWDRATRGAKLTVISADCKVTPSTITGAPSFRVGVTFATAGAVTAGGVGPGAAMIGCSTKAATFDSSPRCGSDGDVVPRSNRWTT